MSPPPITEGRVVDILIVDDEPAFLDKIVLTLARSHEGFVATVRTATNAAEAQKSLQERSPDLLIVDVSLPDVNGIELARQVRAKNFEGDLIVMTEAADYEATLGVLFEIRAALIRKPFQPDELRLLVARMGVSMLLRLENADIKKRLYQAETLSSIGLLAAGIAHEINNPNAFVKGNLEILKRYGDTMLPLLREVEVADSRMKARVSSILESYTQVVISSLSGSERIRKIVSGLLTFGNPERSVKALATATTLVEEAAMLTSFRLKRHEFIVDAPKTLPKLFVNEQEIVQVLMNLFGNAADAIEARGTSAIGRIDIRVMPAEDGWLAFEVHDTGVGIRPDQLGRIFEPFYTTKAVGQGTGLGLSISRGFVESHGGTLTVESKLGVGTTFRMVLPTKFTG